MSFGHVDVWLYSGLYLLSFYEHNFCLFLATNFNVGSKLLEHCLCEPSLLELAAGGHLFLAMCGVEDELGHDALHSAAVTPCLLVGSHFELPLRVAFPLRQYLICAPRLEELDGLAHLEKRYQTQSPLSQVSLLSHVDNLGCIRLP